MSEDAQARLVIDNSVLSAFHTAGWFEVLSFWSDRYELTTSTLIWEDEFTPHHDLSATPGWLQVVSAD